MWREHDADHEHEYKKGGGDREPQQPWGDYTAREGYGESKIERVGWLLVPGLHSDLPLQTKAVSHLKPLCVAMCVPSDLSTGARSYAATFHRWVQRAAIIGVHQSMQVLMGVVLIPPLPLSLAARQAPSTTMGLVT